MANDIVSRRGFLGLLGGLVAAVSTLGLPEAFAEKVRDRFVRVVIGPGDSIQAAIASLPASGGTIFLREGTYELSDPLSLPRNVKIMGEQEGKATLKMHFLFPWRAGE